MYTRDVRLKVLNNGLKVITEEVHNMPIISVLMWYKVGSRNELPGITGASHFVEHMVFKGGGEFKKGEIFKEVNKYGGVLNGLTNNDFTAYFEVLPKEKLNLALRIEKDRMVRAIFNPEEFEAERTVILSELEGGENHPSYLLYKEVISQAFRIHPYRWDPGGFKCDVEGIKRETLYEYYQKYYGPRNAILVVVGDFNSKEVLPLIEEKFGNIKKGTKEPDVKLKEPEQKGERRVILKLKGNNPLLQIAYHIPSIKNEDIFPLVVLDTILSGAQIGEMGWSLGTKTSLLYKQLVRTRLALEADSSVGLAIDPYLFYFSITVQQGVNPENVEKVFLEGLQDIRISEEELNKAKRELKSVLAYNNETVLSKGVQLGLFETISSYRFLDIFLEKIEKVKKEEVEKVAHKYLKEDNRTIGVFIPK